METILVLLKQNSFFLICLANIAKCYFHVAAREQRDFAISNDDRNSNKAEQYVVSVS